MISSLSSSNVMGREGCAVSSQFLALVFSSFPHPLALVFSSRKESSFLLIENVGYHDANAVSFLRPFAFVLPPLQSGLSFSALFLSLSFIVTGLFFFFLLKPLFPRIMIHHVEGCLVKKHLLLPSLLAFALCIILARINYEEYFAQSSPEKKRV